MKKWIKVLLAFIGGWAFWVITGDIGSALLGLILFLYLEFRHANQDQ